MEVKRYVKKLAIGSLLRMRTGRFTHKRLNGGIKKGFVEVPGGPVKANDFVTIPLLSLDPVHVLLAQLQVQKTTTKVLFS
jgi:hypothetical protein